MPLTFPPAKHPATSVDAAAVASLAGPHWLVLPMATWRTFRFDPAARGKRGMDGESSYH